LGYKISKVCFEIYNLFKANILSYRMDLFRRIGTQKKKFKVQFFIGRLKFSNYLAGKVYIIIKRGNPSYLIIGDHKVKS
jgi:hypothetical protein